MPSPPTPRQAGREPEPGALFIEQVVANNEKRFRLDLGMTQSDVADRMRRLGYTSWSATLVSQFEQHKRDIRLREVLGLSLVLNVRPIHLLQPCGQEDLDLDGIRVIPNFMAFAWFNGQADVVADWDGNALRSTTIDVRGPK